MDLSGTWVSKTKWSDLTPDSRTGKSQGSTMTTVTRPRCETLEQIHVTKNLNKFEQRLILVEYSKIFKITSPE